MNAPSIFNFQAHKIRVVTLEGNPWFVALDVCRVLGFDRTDNAMRRIGDEDRSILKRTDPRLPRGSEGSLFPHRVPALAVLSEKALYTLVMRSDKPNAERFREWVAGTVLPAIRKDGGYILGEEKVATGQLSEDELVFRALEVMKRRGATICRQFPAVGTNKRCHLRNGLYVNGFGSFAIDNINPAVGTIRLLVKHSHICD